MGLWAGLGRAQSAYQETAVAAMACANILAAYVLARCVCALLRSTE